MAASNRASRLTKLVADLKKRFKPAPAEQRPLFETILYATLLENSPPAAATKAFNELEKEYYDWNEVRVSSRAELAERLKGLNDPQKTADRLRRSLQSIFETVYAFDLELMKKQNLGQAVKTITEFDGVTPFVVAYATQHGLSGHAIAVNSGVLLGMQVMEIITEGEAKKQTVPGLERAIPKNKGSEAQALLHEMGIEISRNPYGTAARKLLTELDPTCKDRLPKRPAKKEEKPAAPKKAAAKKAKPAEEKPKAADTKAKPAKKAAASAEKAEKPAKKAPAAKPTKKAAATKSTSTKKAAKKTPVKKAAPAKKAPAKKTPAKKAAAKKAPAKKKVAKATPKKAAPKKATAKKAAAAKKAPAKKKPAKKAAKRKPK